MTGENIDVDQFGCRTPTRETPLMISTLLYYETVNLQRKLVGFGSDTLVLPRRTSVSDHSSLLPDWFQDGTSVTNPWTSPRQPRPRPETDLFPSDPREYGIPKVCTVRRRRKTFVYMLSIGSPSHLHGLWDRDRERYTGTQTTTWRDLVKEDALTPSPVEGRGRHSNTDNIQKVYIPIIKVINFVYSVKQEFPHRYYY